MTIPLRTAVLRTRFSAKLEQAGSRDYKVSKVVSSERLQRAGRSLWRDEDRPDALARFGARDTRPLALNALDARADKLA
jgi:hypothetical protein